VAAARSQYESFKVNLKQISAATELDIRQDAEAGEVRMTESRCTALVLTSQSVKEATQAVLQASSRLEELIALKEAYVQRKDMLKELVSMHLSNYYSDPVRGSESRMRDIAVEGVRASRRRDQETNRR
jgi:hypothetical protein